MTDSQAITSVPLMRKLWVVVTLTILLLTFPVALLILLTGPVYRWRDHGWRPISNSSRYVYGGLLALWLAAVVARAILFPEAMKRDMNEAVGPSHQVTDSGSKQAEAKVATATSNPAPADKPESPAREAQGATASQDSSPNMTIAVGGEYNDITITADDDKPFSIQRVVLNDRDGEEKCDFRPLTITADMTPAQQMMASLRTKLPTDPMRRGDAIKFGSTCGDTLTVTVYTDRGTAHYKVQTDQH